MKLMKSKLGQRAFSIQDLGTIAIALVVAVVILGIGGTILETIQGDQTINGSAYNTTGYGLTSITTMASFVPTIAIVAVSAIVIGIILVFFARGR